MTRYSDTEIEPAVKLPALKPIDWSKLRRGAPKPIADEGVSASDLAGAKKGSASKLTRFMNKHAADLDKPLPPADIVIMVWTSAEWAAVDHVFCNSRSRRAPYGQRGYSNDWRKDWIAYARGARDYSFGKYNPKLWGYYRRVQIRTDQKLADGKKAVRTVLLYKAESHLDSAPYLPGLQTNVSNVLADTGARRIYSTGTAGGSRLDQQLGDVVITNAAHVRLTLPDNSIADYNNQTFTCNEWFPALGLLPALEQKLLVPLKPVIGKTANLESLLAAAKVSAAATLKEAIRQADSTAAKKAAQAELAGLGKVELGDLLNRALNPADLATAEVKPLQDVPLLTTDFYYIGQGMSDYGYAFLEMDDAIIAHQAEQAGVQYAFIRNISDPIVPDRTADEQPIPYALRKEWSGTIYSHYGLYTSVNSALAAWSTVAADSAALTGAYNPKRQIHPMRLDDPLEISLVFNVRACGTCSFFWPRYPKHQPYGPYAAYNTALRALPKAVASDLGNAKPQPWKGKSVAPNFPNPEIMDGCRKAPIMTIGINPNLTAFSPGRTGAPWCYPNFETDSGGNAYAKFARYYRYRSVNQESLDLDVVRKYLLPEGQVVAPKNGRVVAATRYSSSPSWEIAVEYEGSAKRTYIELHDELGEAPYVLLFDHYGDESEFKKGDVIAGRLSVPAGESLDIYPRRQTYYGQFVPALNDFQAFLRRKTKDSAIDLAMGEDVCQLDMVACASPHWNPSFLGGSKASENTIIDNCVSQNAWAMKQLVQTKPAVLFLVGESSWHMFNDNFSQLLNRPLFADGSPPDGAFSLYSATKDAEHPLTLEFDMTLDDSSYSLRTRIVVTPHFSYTSNFVMQYRLSPKDWRSLQNNQPGVADYLTNTVKNKGNVTFVEPEYDGDYSQFVIAAGKKKAVENAIGALPGGDQAIAVLDAGYYNVHSGMARVLRDMYNAGELSVGPDRKGKPVLTRNDGACSFCVNSYWRFPAGCPYGKNRETPASPGFLEAVASAMVARGKKARPNPDAPRKKTAKTKKAPARRKPGGKQAPKPRRGKARTV